MQKKIALVPSKNDTGYISEHVQNLHNQGQTGGARDHTQEKGVPHFPSQMYPERGKSIILPPGVKKVVVIDKIFDKRKTSKEFLGKIKNRLGEGLIVDHKHKRVISKKYPKVNVFASFLTVRENLVNELEALAKEDNVPILVLKDKRDKRGSLSQKATQLRKVANYLEQI